MPIHEPPHPQVARPAAAVRRGLLSMVAACGFFCVMGVLIYTAQHREAAVSPLATSFLRIVVNLAVVVAWAGAAGGLRTLGGDARGSLWLRGIFGALALMTSFASIKYIGLGESSFLHSSNGVFVALLAPALLGQRNTGWTWAAVLGALAGLALLFEPRSGDVLPLGRALALASGFLSALAYMMIARAGRSNTPQSVIFYLCIATLALHGLAFAVFGVTWPQERLTWVMLVAAGVFGSIAQIFLTIAYQNAPAALCSAVAYLGPVLNLGAAMLIFGQIPDRRAALGSALVLAFGVALPFLRGAPSPARPPAAGVTSR